MSAARLADNLLALHKRGSLHVMDRGDVCVGCGGQWPCRTVCVIYDDALEQVRESNDSGTTS